MRRASEFSITLEKLSLSIWTSAGLVVTFALRILRATSPSGVSPPDCGHVGTAQATSIAARTNWRRVFTGRPSYFALERWPTVGTQVLVTHESNQIGGAESSRGGRKVCAAGARGAKRRATGLHAHPTVTLLRYSRPEDRNFCTGSVASAGSGLRWKIQRATAKPTATYIRLRAFITPPFHVHRGGEADR